MSSEMMFLIWLLSSVARVPRLVERWKAPFLNGDGRFFGVRVPSDFVQRAGRETLVKYRVRLFLPWIVELPIVSALFAIGRPTAALLVISLITLLTRLNYYADRKMGEDVARKYQIPDLN